jgi:nucleoside-diphosphate-sugar epimerase
MEARAAQKVLVIGATGKQGSKVCDALTSNHFAVFGTSRKPKSPQLIAKGVIPIEFKFGDQASAENAIKSSGAPMVWFMTDYFGAAKSNRSTETQHGKIIVDACKKLGVQHVVFSSVLAADSCPENIGHFKSKLDIENYLRASTVPYSIIRPAAFFKNFDDPKNYNGLKKGSIKRQSQGKHGELRGHWKSVRSHLRQPFHLERQNYRLCLMYSNRTRMCCFPVRSIG